MKNIKKTFLIFTMVLFLSFEYSAQALTSISLDGSFTDWADKPSYSDSSGDATSTLDITAIRWYPDNTSSRLYLYVSRMAYNHTDWNFNVYFNTDLGTESASVNYKSNSRTVSVSLYDKNAKYIWSASGKWGDSKTSGDEVEFYVPLSYLVGSITSGYQINMNLKSGSDYAPDSGYITISSVSTFPFQNLSGVFVLLLVYYLFKRRRGVKWSQSF